MLISHSIEDYFILKGKIQDFIDSGSISIRTTWSAHILLKVEVKKKKKAELKEDAKIMVDQGQMVQQPPLPSLWKIICLENGLGW